MNRSIRILTLVLGATLAVWTGAALAGGGHDHQAESKASEQTGEESGADHPHKKAMLHGGQITMTKGHHFETVFGDDGLRVFVYTTNQTPMMVKKATGTATLKFKDGKTVTLDLVRKEPAENEPAAYFCPMHENMVQSEAGVCTSCNGMKLFVQDYLFAKSDLSGIEPGTMKATIHINGMKGDESEVTFTETFNKASKGMGHGEKGMMGGCEHPGGMQGSEKKTHE